MPDNEVNRIDPDSDIREIARHVAVAAGKIGTTVELREEVGTLAAAVRELVDEVRPLREALPGLARKDETVERGALVRKVAYGVAGLLLLMGSLFGANRYAVNQAHDETCRAINGQNGVLRDLINNSAAGNEGPIDPSLPENIQKIIRENRVRAKAFNDQALKDLADSNC